MLQEYFHLASISIRHRRLRSWLTMLGIFIGIASVVALISLSIGMQEAIEEQIFNAGVNILTISAAGTIAGPLSGDTTSVKLSEEDVDTLKNVPGIDLVLPIFFSSVHGNYRGDPFIFTVMAMPVDRDSLRAIDAISFFDIDYGRSFKQGESHVIILGDRIVHSWFDNRVEIGDTLRLGNVDFKVIGFQKNTGTGFRDLIVRIPLVDYGEVFGREDIATLFALVKEGEDTSEVADRAYRELRKSRNVDEGEEDFVVESPEQAVASFKIILDILQIVLVGISAISLFVGAVGIMNTMYTSVLERRRDIGIMKAVGARNSHILGLFLIESGLYGLLGGTIGVFLGLGLSFFVSFIANSVLGLSLLGMYVSWWLILGALLFSFCIGAVSGVYPAWKASSLKPVETLRS